MNLPIYQMVHVKSSQIEDVTAVLIDGMNLRNPVVLQLSHLNSDEQREVIGFIENWFAEGRSHKYPYPVFIVSNQGQALGQLPVVPEIKALPKFFQQKDGKPNVKEGQVLDRNRLLQQEIQNTDPKQTEDTFSEYAVQHKKLWFLNQEAQFYTEILTRLRKKGT